MLGGAGRGSCRTCIGRSKASPRIRVRGGSSCWQYFWSRCWPCPPCRFRSNRRPDRSCCCPVALFLFSVLHAVEFVSAKMPSLPLAIAVFPESELSVKPESAIPLATLFLATLFVIVRSLPEITKPPAFGSAAAGLIGVGRVAADRAAVQREWDPASPSLDATLPVTDNASDDVTLNPAVTQLFAVLPLTVPESVEISNPVSPALSAVFPLIETVPPLTEKPNSLSPLATLLISVGEAPLTEKPSPRLLFAVLSRSVGLPLPETSNPKDVFAFAVFESSVVGCSRTRRFRCRCRLPNCPSVRPCRWQKCRTPCRYCCWRHSS